MYEETQQPRPRATATKRYRFSFKQDGRMRRHTITTAGDQYATCIRSIRIERDIMQLRPRAVTNVTRRDSESIRFGLPLSSGKRDTMQLPPQVTLNSTRRTSFMQQTRSDSTQLASFERRTRRDATQLTSFE